MTREDRVLELNEAVDEIVRVFGVAHVRVIAGTVDRSVRLRGAMTRDRRS